MKITIKKNEQIITNLEDWYKFSPPKREKKQWRIGRSAMEMARFALSNSFLTFISDLVGNEHISDIEYVCEPEATTSFKKMGKGGPRNHDLLMIGDTSIIGIEAKVSEFYDKKIGEKRKGASENMKKRLDSCLQYLYGEKGNIPDNAEELYYQLFSATIGTIVEARKKNKTKAVALFLTFDGNVAKESDYCKKVKTNNDAFESFCKSLGLSNNGGKLNDIPGLDNKQIECWIIRAKITIESNYTFKC